MNRLLRLYPAVWRDRYGAEFEALLADRPPGLRDRIDIVRGALDARLRPQLADREPRLAWSTWEPWVVAATIAAWLSFIAGAGSLVAQGDPLPYRDAWFLQVTAWIGALLLAYGPLRAISAAYGSSPAGRLLFPGAVITAFLIVGPWPIVIIGFYLFLLVCLVTAIAMLRAEGIAWLLVIVGTLLATSFNTEEWRAWLLVPFGLAWVVVGLLHRDWSPAGMHDGAAPDPLVPAS